MTPLLKILQFCPSHGEQKPPEGITRFEMIHSTLRYYFLICFLFPFPSLTLLQVYWSLNQTPSHLKGKVSFLVVLSAQKDFPSDISVTILFPSHHYSNLILLMKSTPSISTAICMPNLLCLTLLFCSFFQSSYHFLMLNTSLFFKNLIMLICLSPLNYKLCIGRGSHLFYSFMGSKGLDQGQEQYRCSIVVC